MSNSSQLDRFSCGFYEDYIVDKVLLTFLNNHVRKNQRGQEMKAMAWEYLKNTQPELVQSILNSLGVNLTPQQISINTINIAADSRNITPIAGPINLSNVSRLNQNVVQSTPQTAAKEEAITVDNNEPAPQTTYENPAVDKEYVVVEKENHHNEEQPNITHYKEEQESIQEDDLPGFVKIGGRSNNKSQKSVRSNGAGVNLNTNSYD